MSTVWLVVVVIAAAATAVAAAAAIPMHSGTAGIDGSAGSGAATSSNSGGSALPSATTSPASTNNSSSQTTAISQTTALVASRPAPSGSVSIVCGGDMMGDRGVKSYIQVHGAKAVLGGIRSVIAGADLAFANLESPLSNLGSKQAWKDVTFRGDPRLASALGWAGFDVVTMANNHAMDCTASALLDTIKRMNKAGVKVVGAGKNAAAAHKPAIITTKQGIKVAFLGYSDILPMGYTAGSGPGIAAGRSDMARVKADIRAARRRADFVVVAFHWGIEYQQPPTQEQKNEARAAINDGADLVMSHHPHVLEGLEAYHGGLVCYSFGDLVFDHMSRETGETILLRCVVSAKKITAKLIPVYANASGIPSVQHGSSAAAILGRMKRLSAALGTKVRLSGDTATVTVKR